MKKKKNKRTMCCNFYVDVNEESYDLVFFSLAFCLIHGLDTTV